MIQKCFLNLIKASTRTPRFTFSLNKQSTPVQEKPISETPTKKQKSQKSEQNEYEDEQQPLHKQNRNTIGWWIYRFFFWGSFSLLSYNVYLAYGHNKKSPVQQEPTAIPFVIDVAKTIVHNFNNMTEFITQPPSKKLLPDVVHPDFHPKTLVFNLTGTLVKSEYIFGKGNKTIVRPGLQAFLHKLSAKYEIIVFAEEESAFITNSMNSVDPRHRFISSILGKESMVWRSGNYIKDLKYLNRDLKKIIVIDRLKENVKNNPQNLILLSEFDGNKEDSELIKLGALLQRLAGPEVIDVRKEISKLGDNPVNTYYQKIKQKQRTLQKKSGIFGIFTGNPKKKGKESQSDL